MAGSSRSTVYRDLQVLRAAGLALERDLVSGEARHRLRDDSFALRSLGAPQLAALGDPKTTSVGYSTPTIERRRSRALPVSAG